MLQPKTYSLVTSEQNFSSAKSKLLQVGGRSTYVMQTILHANTNDIRIIGMDDLMTLLTWVDAAYATRDTMKIYMGGANYVGMGVLHATSNKQRRNAKSLTGVEVVGIR